MDHPFIADLANPYRPELELQRARAGVHLRVQRLGQGLYAVSGPDGDIEYVSIYPYFLCHCGDGAFRGEETWEEVEGRRVRREAKICKHLIVALEHYGDAEAKAIMARARAMESDTSSKEKKPEKKPVGKTSGEDDAN